MALLAFIPAKIHSLQAAPPPFRRGTGAAQLPVNSRIKMSSSAVSDRNEESKFVWVWTESRQVMTAAVERGWNTFIFGSEPRSKELAHEWSSIALIHPLFIEGSELFDVQSRRVATLYDVSSPQELELLQSDEEQVDNVVITIPGEWQELAILVKYPSHIGFQIIRLLSDVMLNFPEVSRKILTIINVIPAENMVAAFQGCKRTVLAVSTGSSEAQVFLEALEKGLDGVVLKVEEIGEILKLKDYFDRRNEVKNLLALTKAIVTRVDVVGMGDRVCVDLCSLMQPGEGLLVGSFARGLFLVHSECLESNYIASRPFRVNAGPVHAYVAVPGGKTCYLSELKAGKEVMVVGQSGLQRTAIVGRVKIESRPLILVEAKENSGHETYSIFLQNAETVGLVCPHEGDQTSKTAIPVTSLKGGDIVMLRIQGGARHTGIEIQEFILEK